MCKGENPTGAAKRKQTNTIASCQTGPHHRGGWQRSSDDSKPQEPLPRGGGVVEKGLVGPRDPLTLCSAGAKEAGAGCDQRWVLQLREEDALTAAYRGNMEQSSPIILATSLHPHHPPHILPDNAVHVYPSAAQEIPMRRRPHLVIPDTCQMGLHLDVDTVERNTTGWGAEGLQSVTP